MIHDAKFPTTSFNKPFPKRPRKLTVALKFFILGLGIFWGASVFTFVVLYHGIHQGSDNVARPISFVSSIRRNATVINNPTKSLHQSIGQPDITIVHVVFTKFMQTQHNLTELGKARAELFRSFCLPSMVHQTTQKFLWIIRTDPLLEENLLIDISNSIAPYPHYFLIKSNSYGGNFRTSQTIHEIILDGNYGDIISGDPGLLENYLSIAKKSVVLETRLDADDSLHYRYLEKIQQDAQSMFRRVESNLIYSGLEPAARTNVMNQSPPKWIYWCASAHMEWHPGSRDTFRPAGLLLGLRVDHCITTGLTIGYERTTQPEDIPSMAHQKLISHLSTCPKQSEGGCVVRVEDLTPSALRARTITSAGMDHVGTTEGRDSEIWWNKVAELFGINKRDVIRTKEYLLCNENAIALENLMGQCTKGHSCKQEAKDKLMHLLNTGNKTRCRTTSTTFGTQT